MQHHVAWWGMGGIRLYQTVACRYNATRLNSQSRISGIQNVAIHGLIILDPAMSNEARWTDFKGETN